MRSLVQGYTNPVWRPALSVSSKRIPIYNHCTMKKNASIIISVILATLLASCATSSNSSNATVCPDCETVLLDSKVYDDGTYEPLVHKSHSCPGCQGALTTLFKEGKLQHRCSICSKQGFSCPISHPVTKS